MTARNKLCTCGCGQVLPSGMMCSKRKATQQARNARTDARRPSANARGYSDRWRKARLTHLLRHPDCTKCGSPASIVDHVQPHKGDSALFWDTKNWSSLCVTCHSKIKQAEERRLSLTAERRVHPFLPKPRLPVVVVCGPAGSGKSTYCQRHAGEHDIIIDLDVIRTRFGVGVGEALDIRNEILAGLATDTRHERAFFIVSAPTKAEREAWISKLDARLVLLDTPLSLCLERIGGDAKRREIARDWWARYSADAMGPRGTADNFGRNTPETSARSVSGNISMNGNKDGAQR